MDKPAIHAKNKAYWDSYANDWFGATALPEWGVQCVDETELNLFGDVSGKILLDIGCGSGHSLKYLAERHAAELWGLDMSQTQIDNAQKFLCEHGHSAKLICAPMEIESGIPKAYFDTVYSVYAIGWAIDLLGTFKRIASYLKAGGEFIFSWKHPLHHCVRIEKDQLLFEQNYFDESWFSMPLDGSEVMLCNRMISTYINALAQAGFYVERMIEQTDAQTLAMEGDIDDRSKKAGMLPLSFILKARKA